MKVQLFKPPADQMESGGLFIAGGWCMFVDDPIHGVVLRLPEGNYGYLQGLGYTPVATPTPTPDLFGAAQEVLAGPAQDA